LRTIFKNISDSYYYNFNNYPKYVLKLNSVLSQIGIKQVINSPEDHFDELIYKELTILIRPMIEHRSSTAPQEVTEFFSSKIQLNRHTWYIPDFKYEEIRINLGRKIKDALVGIYSKDRNLIIIFPCIFSYNWEKGFKTPLKIIKDIIKVLKELKIKNIDISKTIKRLQIEKFMSQAITTIKIYKEDIIQSERVIRDNNEIIVKEMKQVKVKFASIKALNDLTSTNFKILTKRIEEIKELPFVKSVKLTNDGIAVYIGEVMLNYNNKKVKLGRYRIYILPNKVRIYNLDAIEIDGEIKDHPHILTRNPCFGDWGIEVNKNLAALDLKKLIFTLKLYLQSYNPSSPHVALEVWKKLRKEFPIKKKVPEEGNENETLNIRG